MNLNPRTHRGRFNLTRPISEVVLILFGLAMKAKWLVTTLIDDHWQSAMAVTIVLILFTDPSAVTGFVLTYVGVCLLCAGYIVAFIALDVLYNWTIGAFIFWERPFPRVYPWYTALFTDRLEEHKWEVGRNQSEESKEIALYMCGRLDYYDPGHCS